MFSFPDKFILRRMPKKFFKKTLHLDAYLALGIQDTLDEQRKAGMSHHFLCVHVRFIIVASAERRLR